MKLRIIVISLIALIPNSILAMDIKRNQIFFFVPTVSGTQEAVEQITIVADRQSTVANIAFPMLSSMKAIDSYCTDLSGNINTDWQSGGIPGFKGNMIAIPNGRQTSVSGLEYSISMSNTASWTPHSLINNTGYSVYSTYEANLWPVEPNGAASGTHQCWGQPGSLTDTPGLGSTSPLMPVEINIYRGAAVPGSYELVIPVYWSFIEWKIHNGNPQFNSKWPSTLMQTPNALTYIKYKVNVTSKCQLNNYDAIQINHGVMTPKSALNNEAKATIDLICTDAAMVKVRLLGSNKTDNKSSCGSWGTCELTFDNGTDKDELITYGPQTLPINIKSIFKPKTSEPIAAGTFTGNGVLQILVE
ncbi:hypothetical protein KWI08_08970 [Morganella morganii]|uniref:hypothetical protein n=1 Tax=Morganella morganii TaxID=582 RepID=UPI0021D3A337|nr:hypothetical protein [Morganella morganii]MCU6274027.1 hypothetical protein [Morganella morganii]